MERKGDSSVLGAAEKINSSKVWHVKRGFLLEPDSLLFSEKLVLVLNFMFKN